MKDEIKKAIILLIIVLLILGAVYVVTEYMSGNFKSSKSNTEEKDSVNNDASYDNMIMLSKVFDIGDAEYKVLFYSNKNAKESLKSSIKLYDSAKHDIKLYKVNYDEAINSSVLQNEDNDKATSVNELKVKGPTLVTIKNRTITSYITNENEILSALE